MQNEYRIITTPIGELTLVAELDALIEIRFGGEVPKLPPTRESQVLQIAEDQIAEYFQTGKSQFTVPLNPSGTDFQRRVWQAVSSIPCGETQSYADIAAAIGNPKAFRAVGGANNRNPIPIIIPCHRVVGKRNQLTGYSGGLAAKEFLLDLERTRNTSR